MKPKLIVLVPPAYLISLISKFREIEDAVGAKLMDDIAHIAGLVAAGSSSSQFLMPISTTATHKIIVDLIKRPNLGNDED